MVGAGRVGRVLAVPAQVDVEHDQGGQDHEQRTGGEAEQAAQGEQHVQVVPDRATQDHRHERHDDVPDDVGGVAVALRGAGAPRVPRGPAAGGTADDLEVGVVVLVVLVGEVGDVELAAVGVLRVLQPREDRAEAALAQVGAQVGVHEEQHEAVLLVDDGRQVRVGEAPLEGDSRGDEGLALLDVHDVGAAVALVRVDQRTDGTAGGQLGEHDRREGVEHGLDHVDVEAGELRDAVVDLTPAEHQLLLELLPGEVGQLGQLGGELAVGAGTVVETTGAIGTTVARGRARVGRTVVGTAGTRGLGHDVQPPKEGVT